MDAMPPIPNQQTAGPTWRTMIRRILDEPGSLSCATQPIVALHNQTVVGYEALARFQAGEVQLSPDIWFAEAEHAGLLPELEALALRTALNHRENLPTNTFLTVNVSPHLRSHPTVAQVLVETGDLSRLVFEFTEHSRIHDLRSIREIRDQIERRGGFVALDDAGAGYSGLTQLAAIRPHFVKLDRELVRNIDRDEVKRAVAKLLGEMVGQIDGWLLAEGVETLQELETVAALGIPLVQGFLLGRPAAPWPTLDGALRSHLHRRRRAADAGSTMAALVEHATVGSPATGCHGVGLNHRGKPETLFIPRQGSGHEPVPVSLKENHEAVCLRGCHP